MARRRSTIKGASSYRKFLRRLPDAATAQLVAMLRQAGPFLANDMKSLFPTRRGALRAGITYSLQEKSLGLKVGLVTKATQRKLFYGHILDVGRKAKTVTIKKGPRAGHAMRITALKPIYGESKVLGDFRSRFLPNYRKLTDQMLAAASQGAGDD